MLSWDIHEVIYIHINRRGSSFCVRSFSFSYAQKHPHRQTRVPPWWTNVFASAVLAKTSDNISVSECRHERIHRNESIWKNNKFRLLDEVYLKARWSTRASANEISSVIDVRLSVGPVTWYLTSCWCCVSSQRVISRDGNILSKTSGMQSGGEEEQDEDAHTPLPPRMKIINDPSDPDDKVTRRVFP